MKEHQGASGLCCGFFAQASLVYLVLNVPGPCPSSRMVRGRDDRLEPSPFLVSVSATANSAWEGLTTSPQEHSPGGGRETWVLVLALSLPYASPFLSLSGPPFPHLSSEGLGSDNSEVLGSPISYDQVESFRDLISLPPTLCQGAFAWRGSLWGQTDLHLALANLFKYSVFSSTKWK